MPGSIARKESVVGICKGSDSLLSYTLAPYFRARSAVKAARLFHGRGRRRSKILSQVPTHRTTMICPTGTASKWVSRYRSITSPGFAAQNDKIFTLPLATIHLRRLSLGTVDKRWWSKLKMARRCGAEPRRISTSQDELSKSLLRLVAAWHSALAFATQSPSLSRRGSNGRACS